MVARAIGTLCSALLIWLCALGAAQARHPFAVRTAVRGEVELALRDVSETPLLATRAVSSRIARPAPVERDTPNRLSPLASLAGRGAGKGGPVAGVTLDRQETAYAARPRWRPYDAVAPPAHSRSAR